MYLRNVQGMGSGSQRGQALSTTASVQQLKSFIVATHTMITQSLVSKEQNRY